MLKKIDKFILIGICEQFSHWFEVKFHRNCFWLSYKFVQFAYFSGILGFSLLDGYEDMIENAYIIIFSTSVYLIAFRKTKEYYKRMEAQVYEDLAEHKRNYRESRLAEERLYIFLFSTFVVIFMGFSHLAMFLYEPFALDFTIGKILLSLTFVNVLAFIYFLSVTPLPPHDVKLRQKAAKVTRMVALDEV